MPEENQSSNGSANRHGGCGVPHLSRRTVKPLTINGERVIISDEATEERIRRLLNDNPQGFFHGNDTLF